MHAAPEAQGQAMRPRNMQQVQRFMPRSAEKEHTGVQTTRRTDSSISCSNSRSRNTDNTGRTLGDGKSAHAMEQLRIRGGKDQIGPQSPDTRTLRHDAWLDQRSATACSHIHLAGFAIVELPFNVWCGQNRSASNAMFLRMRISTQPPRWPCLPERLGQAILRQFWVSWQQL